MAASVTATRASRAHARLIGQLQEQEVPGHVVERVHDGE